MTYFVREQQFSRDKAVFFLYYNVTTLSKLYQPVTSVVDILRKFADTCGRMTDYLTMLLAAREKECSRT